MIDGSVLYRKPTTVNLDLLNSNASYQSNTAIKHESVGKGNHTDLKSHSHTIHCKLFQHLKCIIIITECLWAYLIPATHLSRLDYLRLILYILLVITVQNAYSFAKFDLF